MLSDNVQAYTVPPYLTLLPKKRKKNENVIFDMNNIKDKNLIKPTIVRVRRTPKKSCSPFDYSATKQFTVGEIQ